YENMGFHGSHESGVIFEDCDDSGRPGGNFRDHLNLHANDTPGEGVTREPHDLSRGALMHCSQSPAASERGCRVRDAEHESQLWWVGFPDSVARWRAIRI